MHDLRHTFGTQAIREFKIHEVQRMMGHRHITTTERYLHYAPDADGAAKLTALWETAAAEIHAAGRAERTWSRCAAPPDAPTSGQRRGAGRVARPSFARAKPRWESSGRVGLLGDPGAA